MELLTKGGKKQEHSTMRISYKIWKKNLYTHGSYSQWISARATSLFEVLSPFGSHYSSDSEVFADLGTILI